MIGDLVPDLITAKVKIFVVLGALLVVFGFGFKVSSLISASDIAKLKLDHAQALNTALNEKAKEEKRARLAEQTVALGIAADVTEYERKRQNEKAADAKVIADLRNDVNRLRVSTRNAPRIVVPGAAAGACRCDGQGEQTLAPTVAARLAGRYADYNALVDTLDLCQATLVRDRQLGK